MPKFVPATQISTPVVKIDRNPGWYAIYILPDAKKKFRMPGVKDESPRAWAYGPAIVIEDVTPQSNNTDVRELDDARTWKWIEALMRIGRHFAANDGGAVPEELQFWNKQRST